MCILLLKLGIHSSLFCTTQYLKPFSTDNINIESDEAVYKRTDLKREKETKNRRKLQ